MRLSVIYISHNCFQQGKCARTIALNTQVLVLFRNFRDGLQIINLGRQLYPGKGAVLTKAYNDATKEPYGYLIVDMSVDTDDEFRLRTKIFPGEDPVIYLPNSIKDG